MTIDTYIQHSSSDVDSADFGYIKKLAESNFVGPGKLCFELENLLIRKFSLTGALLTDSGEAGLSLVLKQLRSDYPNKDEVIVSSYVCSSVVNAILSNGLKPIFADVTPDSMNIAIEDVIAFRLTKKTLAILCTHIGGIPDDINAALELCVPVISDCAQAIGSKLNGLSLLSYGEYSLISFGPTKFLTAGLGGAVFSKSGVAVDKLRLLSKRELSVNEYKTMGFLLTEGQHFGDLNAGLALSQLSRIDDFLDVRKKIAQQYDEALRNIPSVTLPKIPLGAEPNRFRYYFFSEQAETWIAKLQLKGVDARASISHVMTDYFRNEDSFVHLDRLSRQVVSLPIYSRLKERQVSYIINIIKEIEMEIV